MAKKEQTLTPLDEITDGQRFQQIVAAYFRCFKTEAHNYSIVDVNVEDSGIGPDGGCDILVEFIFEDIISKYSHRWVFECKCHENPIGIYDINTNNIRMILDNKKADGYLLVCKKDASSRLNEMFNENNKSSEKNIMYGMAFSFGACVLNQIYLLKHSFLNIIVNILLEMKRNFLPSQKNMKKKEG